MTWTRRELKETAKKCLSANYWKLVLVSLIVMLVFGGSSGGSSSGSSAATGAGATEAAGSAIEINPSINGFSADKIESIVGTAIAGVILVLILLVIIAVMILVYIYVVNPLQVGCSRFFIRSLHDKAEVREIAYGYDHGYRNVVKTLFKQDLRIFLWSLLLIIPGIIKSYEYRMIPYLLAENPELATDDAFAQSKAMMTGNKWKTFVLDLSFLGWDILSLLTAGILGVFYVNPYRNMTFAALYEKLRYGDGTAVIAEQ